MEKNDIDWARCAVTREAFDELIAVDNDAWHSELVQYGDWFARLGSRLPRQLKIKHDLIVARFSHAPAA